MPGILRAAGGSVYGPPGYGRSTGGSRTGPSRILRPMARDLHPANQLNELTGEEWLYFTKSLLVTAYPSELGHAARKRHGANKPPRLMARLIEFFTKTGELVLDPFAGVGGTLLGAAIARGPRRAIGLEINPAWAAVYAEVVGRARGGARRGGTAPRRPRHRRPGRPARLRSRRLRDAHRRRPRAPARRSPDASVDFVATDPPYTVQLPLTMAGGRLAEAHANRRTDYAMVSDDPADLANAPTHDAYLDAMERVFGELARVLRPGPLRRGHRARRLRRRGLPLHRAPTSPRGRRRVGLVPKGDLIWYQAGTRLRPYGYPRAFVPNITHQHIVILRREPDGRPPLRPSAAPARRQVGHQDVGVDLGSGASGRRR